MPGAVTYIHHKQHGNVKHISFHGPTVAAFDHAVFAAQLMDPQRPPTVTRVRRPGSTHLVPSRIPFGGIIGGGFVLQQLTLPRDAAARVSKGQPGEILVELNDAVVVEQLGQKHRLRSGLIGRFQPGLAGPLRDARPSARRHHGGGGGVVARVDVPVGFVPEQNIFRPAGERGKLPAHDRDFPGPPAHNGRGGTCVDEILVLKQGPLEALLHEDQILSVQRLGARDEGRTDRRQRFGDPKRLGRRESLLEKCGQPVEPVRVRIWLLHVLVNAGRISTAPSRHAPPLGIGLRQHKRCLLRRDGRVICADVGRAVGVSRCRMIPVIHPGHGIRRARRGAGAAQAARARSNGVAARARSDRVAARAGSDRVSVPDVLVHHVPEGTRRASPDGKRWRPARWPPRGCRVRWPIPEIVIG